MRIKQPDTNDANAFKKAIENYRELLKDDPGDPEIVGTTNFSRSGR